MLKRVLVLCLIALLVLSLGVFGAKTPKDYKMLQRLERLEKQGMQDESIISGYLTALPQRILLPFTDDTVGFTWYDFQHNDVQRRMIANDSTGGLHFTWMDLIGPDLLESRYIDYNFRSYTGTWVAAGTGLQVTPPEGRGGYGGLDILPDNREVLCYHRTAPTTPTADKFWGTAISIEKENPGYGEFNHYDIPDSIVGVAGTTKGEWPTVGCARGTTDGIIYIHITHAEGLTAGGSAKHLGYVRCYEGTNDTLICASPGWASPRKILPGVKLVPNSAPYSFSITKLGGTAIATSAVSQKVAICWLQNATPSASNTQNEVMYLESTNNGKNWMTAGNMGTPVKITNYQAAGFKDVAYDDIAAVYDYNDNLHIIWNTFASGNQNDVTLWHWSGGTGVRKMGSHSASSDCNPGSWNNILAKMTAGVEYQPSDSAYNYIYTTYTKFRDGDTSAAGYANGDICLKASSNGGLTWGPEVNLTNTSSNGCAAGDCKSEHWSSIAERVDSFLYVQYIYDLDAGGAVRATPEGTFTNDPVRYLRYHRPLVPSVPTMSFSPVSMTSPVRWALNGGTKSDTLYVDNTGTATLQVQLSGPSWLTATPNSFSIIEAGATQKVNLTLSGLFPLNDTFVTGQIKILSNNGVVNGGPYYNDTQYVDINFVVTDTFYLAEYDTCKRGPVLVVSNVGNMGAQSDSAGMFWNGLNYLFDASPVMVTNQIPGYAGNKGFSWIHSKADFLPAAHLKKDDYPNLNATVYSSSFEPLNWRIPATNFSVHWAWLRPTKHFKIIQFTYNGIHAVIIYNWWTFNNKAPKWWMDGVTAPTPVGGYFGIAGDWDVTASFSGKDKGGIIDSLNLVYLRQDTVNADKYYGGFQFLSGYVKKGATTTNYTTPFAMHVGNNQTQMYPFTGYSDDSLWKYMSMPGDFIEQDSAQDMNIIISGIEMLNPDTTTEIGMFYAAVVSDSNLANLTRQAAALKKVKPGDANVDGKVTVSDVVYLVNYLFKGGPAPWMIFSDANGDTKVTVSDVVYLVNYLFKGGPQAKFVVGDKPF